MNGSAGLLALIAVIPAAANEIKLVHVDARLTHLLASLLILPRVIFEFAVNERLVALAVILRKGLSARTPHHALGKIDLLADFPGVAVLPFLIHGNAKLSHSRAALEESSLGISREIALQNHDVHFFFFVGCFCSFFGGDHAISALSSKYGAANRVT